jgi:hypothetical protein
VQWKTVAEAVQQKNYGNGSTALRRNGKASNAVVVAPQGVLMRKRIAARGRR